MAIACRRASAAHCGRNQRRRRRQPSCRSVCGLSRRLTPRSPFDRRPRLSFASDVIRSPRDDARDLRRRLRIARRSQVCRSNAAIGVVRTNLGPIRLCGKERYMSFPALVDVNGSYAVVVTGSSRPPARTCAASCSATQRQKDRRLDGPPFHAATGSGRSQ
jgi:hypothetical protein